MLALIWILYQDIKSRLIHVSLPIIIFVSALIINYYSIELNFKMALFNAIFILINIIGLVIYFSVKNKKLINPINKSIGLGDLLFFFALTPLFNVKPFIVFFIFGLLFSLVTHLLISILKKDKNATIPLAGYLSAFLIINILFKSVFKITLIA